MALLFFQAGAAQGYAMVDGHVVAHDGGLANHHSHAVVDEEPSSDGRAGMNLNPGPEAGDLREVARQQTEAMPPEPVIQVMHPHRVKSRIVQQHGEPAGGRRIAVQHGLNVFSNGLQHALASPSVRCPP